MKLRYILGRAGRGKTRLIFEDIKKRLTEKGENRFILLVPEQFTLQTEFDLIMKNNIPGITRVEVLSFERLAYRVFDEVGGLKRIGINEYGKLMVLRRLFDTYSKELKVYGQASKQEGFLSDFCSLITEFKKNDISHELLREILDTFEGETLLKRKLEDIAYIYGQYNDYMTGRYTDEEDKFSLLIERIDEVKFLDGAEIWIDGFTGFTEKEYKVIEKLLLKAHKVNIALTLDDVNKKLRDREVFDTTLKTFKKLREIAGRHNIRETKIFLNKDLDNKPEDLKHLEKEFFAYPYNKYDEDVENIEIFSATNQYTEIENAAIKIISLVREKGYRWRDIALVNGSMDTYGLTIKRVFSEYGIPFFIDEKRSIVNNPIIKLILSTLDILHRNFKYEDVFRFIKTGFCNLTKDEYEILENYVLRYGIEGNRWFEDFIFGEEDRLEEINEIRKKFIEPFEGLKARLKGKNSVRDISTYIFEFLTELGIEEKLNTWLEKLREKGRIEYVNENTQIWNIVMEVLDQLVEILGDAKLSLKEYRKVLEAGFSEYEVGIIPPTIDQVLVGNLERSRSHDIKALFIVGVNDGILPSEINDDGLLLDEEKILIKEKGVPLSSDSETRVSQERLSIYTALSKPTEYLWISYAMADCEGRALRPSIFIDRFKKLYPRIEISSDIAGKIEEDEERQKNLISTPVPTFKYLIENLRLKIDGNPVLDLWDEVYNWYYSNEEWHDRLNMMIEGLFHDNQEDYIGENLAKSLYSVPLRSSISRLEKFVNCPFSHFISYGLKPRERKEYKIRIPDIGKFFHDSMEKFAKELTLEKLDWRKLSREKCDEIVDRIIDEITPEFENSVLLSTHRYKYLVNKLRRVSKRAAWTLTEHVKRGQFTPLGYEFEFGEGMFSHVPPIILELPDGDKVYLEGRIDRIDILRDEDGTYVKIIDYKSGYKRFRLSDVYYGLQIQLIVYLDAVIENKDKLMIDDIHPGGAFYFKLDDPMIESDIKDTEAIEQEIMKKLKMDGIITKDIKVVKAMDMDIKEGDNSLIIPVKLNKDGNFGKNSSVLEEVEIMALIKHVRNLIIEIAAEILKGNIKIEPCKVDNSTPCKYCQYMNICQFDKTFENNGFKIIRKLDDDEVIGKIEAEIGGECNA